MSYPDLSLSPDRVGRGWGGQPPAPPGLAAEGRAPAWAAGVSTAMPSLHALLLALETQVWEAARTGDVAADLRLLSPDFLGVYAAGWADREAHAAQLGNGSSVATYALSRVRVLALGDGVGLISYLADFTVPGHRQSLQTRVSSVWRLDERGGWHNVFSQDTALPEP